MKMPSPKTMLLAFLAYAWWKQKGSSVPADAAAPIASTPAPAAKADKKAKA